MINMEIQIKNGFVIIDSNDYELIKDYKWYNGCGYAVAYCDKQKKQIKMHRLINNTPRGYDTDHINRNTLDNRRVNLRAVTRSVNCQNVPARLNSSSKYKGVYWKNTHLCYGARITKNKKTYFLGHFSCPIEAAKEYDRQAIILYGDNAATNF